MFKLLWALPLLLLSGGAQAFEIGDWRLDGHVYGGYNSVQDTYIGVGVDFYTYVEDRLATGVGAYYTSGTGSNASNDREIGVGPFVSYSYPLLDFLIPSIREDLDYVDERDPLQITSGSNVINTYQSYYGMASITSVALHLFFTQNFGVGVGYRFALALNNSNLEKDHSGVFFSLAIGI